MGAKISQQEFVKRVKKIFGNKYDFSESVYENSKIKVRIICPLHGVFYQSPNHLFKGISCPSCGGTKKLTQKEFEQRATEKHNGKYDYSLSKYTNYEAKIAIICPKHGTFYQSPHRHLDGGGCPDCGGSKPLNNKIFIERAKSIHGDKYEYSLVDYKNADKKIEIICKIHGSFFQRPIGHLLGWGCRKCAGNYNISNDEFISRANEIHNEYYDYSKTKYISLNKKVIITCKFHGDFEQSAINHLNGSGCYTCSIVKKWGYSPQSDNLTNELIALSKQKHGNIYDLSKVVYRNNISPIIVGCKTHGFVKILPLTHINGVGCPVCAIIEVGDKKKKSFEHFIKKSKEVHGNKYEYKNFESYKSRTEVQIKCKKHGWFTQLAYAHLRGQGCPKCKESYGERLIRLYLSNNEIKYKYQKKFNDCKNKSYLFFDFYIPSKNVLIEFDGEQHFKVTRNETFGGKEVLKKIKENDRIKNNYCKQNNIKLIRIKYTEINKISEILDKML